MKIRDSVIVVTGGASGLGLGTVRRLVAEGAKVLIADANGEAGSKVALELGDAVRFALTDVADEASAKAAFAMVHDAFGTLQGLVNCAGVSPAETVLGKRGVHRLDSFMRTVRINLVGTFNMIRLAAEMMSTGTPNQEGERGVIVNTASAAAFEGQVGQAGYSASKGGVVAMTLPIARELARWGIRNATIAPGVFETPLMRELSNEKRETMLKRVPFPSRAGRPSEFAQLVQQIFENPMLNGEVIRLDGALRLAPS